jgi:hypothetical protein
MVTRDESSGLKLLADQSPQRALHRKGDRKLGGADGTMRAVIGIFMAAVCANFHGCEARKRQTANSRLTGRIQYSDVGRGWKIRGDQEYDYAYEYEWEGESGWLPRLLSH